MSTYSERKEQLVEELRMKLMNKAEEIIRNAYNLGAKQKEAEMKKAAKEKAEYDDIKLSSKTLRSREAGYILGFRAAIGVIDCDGRDKAMEIYERILNAYSEKYEREVE